MCTKKMQYVQNGGPSFDDRCSYPGPYFIEWHENDDVAAFPTWRLFSESILSYDTSTIEKWVLWFTFDTQAKKLITDKALEKEISKLLV